MRESHSETLGWKWMFWSVVGCALLIRLWETWYGLPMSYYADEYHEVMRALALGAGSFSFERTGKGGLYLLLFLEYGFYFVYLKVTGVVSTAADFAEMVVRDPSAVYLMGRVTVALFGSITVVAIVHLGRRAFSREAGLLAGTFLAVNVLHIDLSRLIGVDVPMTMLSTMALYFAIRIAASGQRKYYLLAAVCAALATTTKVTGIIVVLPLLVAHTYAVANGAGGMRGWFRARDLWLSLALFSFVLVATNPGIVDTEHGYQWLFTASPNDAIGDAAEGDIPELLGVGRPNLYVYYLSALQASMGWPLFILSLFSIAYAFWKRTRDDVILLTFGFCVYLVLANIKYEALYYPRYALPIIIVLCLLTGRLVADLMRAMVRNRVAKMATIIGLCIAVPVRQAIATAYVLTQPDTRTLAKQWFEAHVPTGSRVLIEGGKIVPARTTVPLRDTADAIRRRIGHWKVEEPKQASFLKLELAVHEGGGYDLELVRSNAIATLDDYIGRGIEYFVVRPEAMAASRKIGGGTRLLDDLRSNPSVRLIKRFESDERQRPGPTIEVYRLLIDTDRRESASSRAMPN